MNQNNLKNVSLVLGVVIAALGVLGLFMGEGRVRDEMNINLFFDIVPIALGAFLIWGGIRTAETARSSLGILGIVYLGIFLVGLFSNSIFGLAPAGVGAIDQVLHLGGGLLGIVLAMVPVKRMYSLR